MRFWDSSIQTQTPLDATCIHIERCTAQLDRIPPDASGIPDPSTHPNLCKSGVSHADNHLSHLAIVSSACDGQSRSPPSLDFGPAAFVVVDHKRDRSNHVPGHQRRGRALIRCDRRYPVETGQICGHFRSRGRRCRCSRR